MKKWLIATGNRDKFTRTVDVFKSFYLEEVQFLSLSDLDIFVDVVENGSILERAVQKVEFYRNILLEKEINDIDVIVGIDEGMQLPEQDPTPESKKIASQLLSGETGEPGDIIEIVMGSVFLEIKKNKLHICLVQTPYVFLGNNDEVEIKEGTYPLAYVFARIGTDVPMIELTDQQATEYFLKYWKEEYERVFLEMGYKLIY